MQTLLRPQQPRKEVRRLTDYSLLTLKKRLDQLLVDKGLATTIKEAQGYIRAGQVFVDDVCSDKPGTTHQELSAFSIKGLQRFVSRGGLKLEKALEHFGCDVHDFVCVDIGASTGGFTDCLLQNGAKHVYAVDVAYGQFAWKLRQDAKVTVIERFNARNLSRQEIINPVDLIVIDASFISLTKILPPLLSLFDTKKKVLALIKPQFELAKDLVGNGGVVKDAQLHEQVIQKIADFAVSALGLKVQGVVASPILGPKGNKEFVIYLTD